MADNLHEQPFGNEVLTTEHLFDELVAIANINQSFRQGRQDFTRIFTETSNTPSLDSARIGDETDKSIAARLIDKNTGEVEWPGQYTGMQFSLEAKRVFECIIDERDDKSVTQNLFLTYIATEVTKNISLPAGIASKAYEIDNPDKAIENGGRSQRDDITIIKIDSKNFTPSVCFATVWRDSNDDDVSVDHSCHDLECDFSDPFRDTEQQLLIQSDGKGPMRVINETAEANGDNIPEVTEIEPEQDNLVSQFDWTGFEQANSNDDKSEHDLQTAFDVLESLKKAFREQLGMNIRPTFPRQKDKI